MDLTRSLETSKGEIIEYQGKHASDLEGTSSQFSVCDLTRSGLYRKIVTYIMRKCAISNDTDLKDIREASGISFPPLPSSANSLKPHLNPSSRPRN